MIITTSFSIEGSAISEYLGIVAAAKVISTIGGNKMVLAGWQTGVSEATEILTQKATSLGADAVIAVRFEIASGNIYATGTAVKLC